MKSIINEIYLNSIEGDELNGNESYESVRKICNEAYDKLYAGLTEEQKNLFKRYYDAEGDLACEWESYVFERGFRLGMLLCIEVMH